MTRHNRVLKGIGVASTASTCSPRSRSAAVTLVSAWNLPVSATSR
ncbi:Uncharacterised protein [Bordetella pertussis]|nr:Uncharacterised protein [Bordetella pertussis]